MKKAKTVLTLNGSEAFSFYLDDQRYHNLELPEYFNFTPVLSYIKDKIGDTPIENCINKSPDNLEDVNLEIMMNKDGRYAVRPLGLVNPYLYYFLVRVLCNNWNTIKECFNHYHVDHITPCAITVIPEEKESFKKSTTILNWWNQLEQRSIELSLEYRYMFVTDITNCYGTINPQTIDWALNCKDTVFENDEHHQLALNLQNILRSMQHGRNIGIPQGSDLFDLVAEIILGYADLKLHEAIVDEGIGEHYEILRYRDDYRIFCNDKDTLEKISYLLQSILEELNFRMNSSKTKVSENIIADAIKQDKQFYIFNTPIFNKKGTDFDGLQKHLLYILMFGRKYKNGGQLKNMLTDLDKRIAEKDGKTNENICAMAAIATQIAVENVNITHYALRIISRLVAPIKNTDKKWNIIKRVYHKLSSLPNSTYTQVWLQNITYQRDKFVEDCPYELKLCRLVAQDEDVQLWNNSWMKQKYTKGLPIDEIIDRKKLEKNAPIIIFHEKLDYYEGSSNDVQEDGWQEVDI